MSPSRINILDLLLPRETKFFHFLNEQARIYVEGCVIFHSLVSNIEKLNLEEIKEKLVLIKDAEMRADTVEMKVIDELHKTFITPIDREDIHTIVLNTDRATDILNSIAQKITMYDIRKVPDNVIKFADIIVEIAKEVENLFTALEKRGEITAISEKMHRLENNADYLFRLSIAQLFKEETNPIEIIKFKEIYEHLEAVVDATDYIGKIVRGVVVKRG